MRVGDCPSCRAPVDFRPGAGKVKVCEHCNTVVLRGEANLESLGKVAELADTESPLKLGLSGQSSGTRFTVVGRIQKRNERGVWDEWCLAFDDERTAWLSESEGEWNLMYPLEGVPLPDEAALRPLFTFPLRDRRFVVEEVNQAEAYSAQGQLPDFNRKHLYADCTGPRGTFCSLDYADGTKEAYVGNRTSLAALGFDRSELAPTPRRDALSAARCTNCNGMLALKAPDATKRVACPYCGALLSVEAGKLAFLQLLEKPPREPLIPLGAAGTLDGVKWTALAFFIRSCRVEGTRYEWEEYLLWERAKGFVWLMNANAHWTLLTPIPAGEVTLGVRALTYGGQPYKAYQSVIATTDYVVGECYWQANVGDMAKATEYINPPQSVSIDETSTEVTFTHGRLLPAEAVRTAFGVKGAFPRPYGLAPAQENPFKEKASSGWKWAGLWAVALIALVTVFAALGTTETYYEGSFSVPPGVTGGSPESQRFSEPFEIKKKVPLEVRIDAPGLSNNWLGVSVDLVNQETGEVIAVYGESEHYSGVTDGESWSEGSRHATKQTSEVDRGFYVMRLTPSFEAGRAVDYLVKVSADDGAGVCCPLFIFLVLLVVPLYYTVRASSFETQRWNDSVFQG